MNTIVVAAGIVAGLAFAVPAVAQTRPTVAIVVKDTTMPHWQTVLAGARRAGQDLGANVVEFGAHSESDANGQIDMLTRAVSSNPAAIVIAPAQSPALGRALDDAAKRFKIIGIESAADSTAMTSLIASDNAKAGRIAADALASAITRTYGDTEGNVVIITSMPGVPALDRRSAGFREVLAAKYRALDIVADKAADGQPTTVRSIMKDLIASTADLRGVFAADGIMAEAVAQAVVESKSSDKVNVVGVGASEKLVKLLQDEVIAGLVVEDPFRMGYEAVKTALSASKGEQVAAYVEVGAALVTKANIGSAGSQVLLNPRMK